VSHVHGARISPLEIGTWFGVRVTVVARTLADLARHSRRDAIIAADAALRERLATRDQIDSALARAAGWPGVRQARDVLALADPRAESPLESLTRLALHDDGFPQPELQVWIGRYRVDMLFRRHNLVLESDGLAKYTPEELRREKRRELDLHRLGYRVERVIWADVVHRWRQTSTWLRSRFDVPA
jgi:very-short-patch-repair endonuclease